MSRRAPFVGGPADGKTYDLTRYQNCIQVPQLVDRGLSSIVPSLSVEDVEIVTYDRVRFGIRPKFGEPRTYDVLVPQGEKFSNERVLVHLLVAADDYISELEALHGTATR